LKWIKGIIGGDEPECGIKFEAVLKVKVLGMALALVA
jgi:hypothetical protein